MKSRGHDPPIVVKRRTVKLETTNEDVEDTEDARAWSAVTADDLWALFIDMYDPDMIAPDALAWLEEAVRAAWKEHTRPDSELLSCAFKMLAVSATR